jgi:glyoxylase-like metal-dependent hydrolase (beta-lactamase superfamily II)
MLRLEQWLAGRDFARDDPTAAQLCNFVYLVADERTRQAVLVDPAWDIDGLLTRVEQEGYTLAGTLATHYHPDHVGGDLWGIDVAGIARVRALAPQARLHAHHDDAPWIERVTGVPARDLALHRGGDTLELGSVKIEFVHTPGHTPGSTCFLVSDPETPAGQAGSVERPALVSGDTLFVGGCGRVDLPGSDPDEMYRTLTQRLARLPAATVLHPGHDYGPAPTSTLERERAANPYLRVDSLEAWRRLMGR